MQYSEMNSHYISWHMILFSYNLREDMGILPCWKGYKAHIDFLNGETLYIN